MPLNVFEKEICYFSSQLSTFEVYLPIKSLKKGINLLLSLGWKARIWLVHEKLILWYWIFQDNKLWNKPTYFFTIVASKFIHFQLLQLAVGISTTLDMYPFFRHTTSAKKCTSCSRFLTHWAFICCCLRFLLSTTFTFHTFIIHSSVVQKIKCIAYRKSSI